MCIRPDITYVTTQAVVDTTELFVEKTGLNGELMGFDCLITAIINVAEQAGDINKAKHWRQVRDFGMRHHCSPMSAWEVDGKTHREQSFIPESWIPDAEDMIRVYIGNPLNPQHRPQQLEISIESMESINAGYEDATAVIGSDYDQGRCKTDIDDILRRNAEEPFTLPPMTAEETAIEEEYLSQFNRA